MLYRNNEINVKQVIYNIRECRKRNNMSQEKLADFSSGFY